MGLSPNNIPFNCRAFSTEFWSANSTKANLVGWVSSPAIRTNLTSPQVVKNCRSCSAVAVWQSINTIIRIFKWTDHYTLDIEVLLVTDQNPNGCFWNRIYNYNPIELSESFPTFESKFPTYIVLRISSTLFGSTFPGNWCCKINITIILTV